MTQMKDDVVVITGAATGVGRALAREAAERGARVVVSDVMDGSETVDMIRSLGGEAVFYRADVSDYAAVAELAAFALNHYGAVTVLVNNAAFAEGVAPVDIADPEATRKLLEVSVLGVFHGIRAFAGVLKASAAAGRRAAILNVGSEHSLGVPPHVEAISTYTVAKYAVLGLTDTARRDFAGTGVQVSLLASGWVRTERIREAVAASREAALAIEPFAQNSDEVARQAWDGVASERYIIATNPASREFAMQHLREVMAEVQRLPALPASDVHVHDGSGDIDNCPVGHLM